MATVNKRVKLPVAAVINGIDAGGLMACRISAGYDNILESAPDGLHFPTVDREVQFVRGTVTTQDYTTILSILAGTLGTYTFYERKSGVAAATGWIKHTITNPVIHAIKLSQSIRGFVTATFNFECKFTSETATFADMWAQTDAQAEPTYVAATRGGYRVKSTTFDPEGTALSIYHVTAFEFSLAMRIAKACNDADLGYTCVDADPEAGIAVSGSLNVQDSTITTSSMLAVRLLALAAKPLELTLATSGGATDKVITIANVIFTGAESDSNVTNEFTGYPLPFRVANAPGTPLTLAGANKLITIADAA